MWRKVVAMLLGLSLLITPYLGTATAEGGTTVILVSDNEADSALAEYLANLTGAVVVTTEWGIYDPAVTVKVMAYAPDRVVIIGGPEAVVEQYVDDLRELGIDVERWWGMNRYETNLAVLKNATKLGLKFENSVVLVPGNDSAAIREALREALKAGGVILFINSTADPVKLMAKLGFGKANVTVIASPVTERVTARVTSELGTIGIRLVSVNITAEMALDAINVAEERINAAENLLNNVSLDGRMTLASRILNLATIELERAKDAYKAGNYGLAYGQALAAKGHAEVVVRMASDEWNVMITADPAMGVELFIFRVEKQLAFMEKAGIDVSEIRLMLNQLREALANGDYDLANALMMRIRAKLAEAYMQGKDRFAKERYLPTDGKVEP